MKQHSAAYDSQIVASDRRLRAEFISAHEHSYNTDYIKSISIQIPQVENKLFGYSVSAKAKVVLLRNTNRTPFTIGEYFQIKLGTAAQLIGYPTFYIDNISEDAKSGDITIEGYDCINKLNNYTFSDLGYGPTWSKTIEDICEDIAAVLNVSVANNGVNLSTTYTQSTLNVTGDTSLRDICNHIADATGTILSDRGDSGSILGWTTLSDSGSDITITKANYFEFSENNPVSISRVISSNALGDNIAIGTDEGSSHVIFDNAFLSLLPDEDKATMLTNILGAIGKNTYGYKLTWRGNPALQYGDRVYIQTKDSYIYANYFGENLEYEGGMKSESEYNYEDSETITSTLNSSISSSIKRTEAIVDKAAGSITLIASEVEELDGRVTANEATLVVHDTEIQSKVSQSQYDTKMASVDSNISGLNSRVTTTESTITQQADQIALVVQKRQGQNVIKAASIVEAINNESSSVKISADHVDIEGNFVTFTDLSTSGRTTINGDNITTGSINASRITTGSLSADRINGGTMTGSAINLIDSQGDTGFSVDSSGELNTYGGSVSTKALVVQNPDKTAPISTLDPETGLDTFQVKTDKIMLPNNITVLPGISTDTIYYYYLKTNVSSLSCSGGDVTITIECKGTNDNPQAINVNNFGRSLEIEGYVHLDRTSGKHSTNVPDYSIPFSVVFPANASSANFTVHTPYGGNYLYYHKTYTDGYTGTNRWINTATSERVGLTVNSSILPNSSNTYNLGGSSYKWQNIYASNLSSGSSSQSVANIVAEETWTFTLDDNTTVTKKVNAWTQQ